MGLDSRRGLVWGGTLGAWCGLGCRRGLAQAAGDGGCRSWHSVAHDHVLSA